MDALQPLADREVRAAAIDVLNGSEYAHWHGEHDPFTWALALLEWLRQISRSLDKALQAFGLWLGTLRETEPLLYLALVVGLFLVALALLGHVAWSLRAALRARPEAAAERPRPSAPPFLEEADALARAGRFLDAAHRLQIGLIGLLLERRVLDLSRFEPNRTLRQRLSASELPASERLQILSLLDQLEARWFGDRRQERELYTAWRSLHQSLAAPSDQS